MGLSIWHIAVVAILFVLLFGRGKLSGVMTDLAEGIKGFRTTMREGGESPSQQLKAETRSGVATIPSARPQPTSTDSAADGQRS